MTLEVIKPAKTHITMKHFGDTIMIHNSSHRTIILDVWCSNFKGQMMLCAGYSDYVCFDLGDTIEWSAKYAIEPKQETVYEYIIRRSNETSKSKTT